MYFLPFIRSHYMSSNYRNSFPILPRIHMVVSSNVQIFYSIIFLTFKENYFSPLECMSIMRDTVIEKS